MINERLKSALDQSNKANSQEVKETVTDNQEQSKENKIVTSSEELEGFLIVKTILRKKIDANRIFHRDFQNFFSVLLDDTIRQTICRLYFEENKKQISVFENKKEIKFEIATLDDIFKYEEQILKSLDNLIPKTENPTE